MDVGAIKIPMLNQKNQPVLWEPSHSDMDTLREVIQNMVARKREESSFCQRMSDGRIYRFPDIFYASLIMKYYCYRWVKTDDIVEKQIDKHTKGVDHADNSGVIPEVCKPEGIHNIDELHQVGPEGEAVHRTQAGDKDSGAVPGHEVLLRENGDTDSPSPGKRKPVDTTRQRKSRKQSDSGR